MENTEENCGTIWKIWQKIVKSEKMENMEEK